MAVALAIVLAAKGIVVATAIVLTVEGMAVAVAIVLAVEKKCSSCCYWTCC